MFYRIPAGVMALAAAMLLTIAGTAAFDDSIYPAFNGQWRRAPGVGIGRDESKPRGLAQQPPLTPEYQKIWEASIADQEAGGQEQRHPHHLRQQRHAAAHDHHPADGILHLSVDHARGL
jgi:hypothetical protein